jgi:hypothetical protein
MIRRSTAAAALAASALAVTLFNAPAHAAPVDDTGSTGCFEPASVGAGARTADGSHGRDTRAVTRQQQKAIERRMDTILSRSGHPSRAAAVINVPVYVHVMRAADGTGNATKAQIQQQVAVLNATYGGDESPEAADTGFTFTLQGVDRYKNDLWHADRHSKEYRRQTRQGGAEALNIWLVDFDLLGIATFPWDYAGHAHIDGIRVNVGSLPGGPIANFNLGETATHEAGHWFGLYHTFQGGCTPTNDLVADTAAQSSPSSGCPVGRDSCVLPDLDPIHNYMDYSFDSCYDQFTAGQNTRMHDAFAAFRA